MNMEKTTKIIETIEKKFCCCDSVGFTCVLHDLLRELKQYMYGYKCSLCGEGDKLDDLIIDGIELGFTSVNLHESCLEEVSYNVDEALLKCKYNL